MVKDLALPQLWFGSLASDPWPRNSICCGVAKKGKEKTGGGGQDSDTSRINILSLEILLLNNTLHFLEKWLITGLGPGRIHDESGTCARNREVLRKQQSHVKGQEPA